MKRGFGIPDEDFIRGDAPITKQEVRAVTIAKARIKEGDVVYDIGAGTGSISIEAAMLAGRVYAIEKEASRVALVKKNIKKFQAKNITVVHGDAPEALYALPQADVIVIGGSGGRIKEILLTCDEKLKRGGRIVVNAITIETLASSISTLKKMNYAYSAALVSISRLEKLGKSELLKAQNPVFVIAAEKAEGLRKHR